MKRTKPFIFSRFSFIILLLGCVLMQGCTVQKRHYRRGFYVHGFRKSQDKELAGERRSRGIPRNETITVAVQKDALEARGLAITASAEKQDILQTVSPEHSTVPLSQQAIAREQKQSSAKSDRKEERRKAEFMGIVAFLASAGGWVALVYLPIGILQGILFGAGAILAALSMRKMSQQPERYVLKTLSFIALLLALIGLAVMLYAGLIYLLS